MPEPRDGLATARAISAIADLSQPRGREQLRMAERFPFKSLRHWLKFLEEQGDLARVTTEVDADQEISAIAYEAARTPRSPSFLFEKIKGYPGWRIATGTLLGTRRQAWVLGAENPANLVRECALKLDQRVPPIEVSTAYCR